jgi:hypothetical protein
MKLKAGHLFLILLLSLIFCCGLGGMGIIEGMDNSNTDQTQTKNSSLGIPKSKIPKGQEDLYILKSQIVTPTCPVTPSSGASAGAANISGSLTGAGSGSNGADIYSNEKCPPCPACARCPEPSFECVKKPVYKPDNPYLPVPVLTSFSSFGM